MVISFPDYGLGGGGRAMQFRQGRFGRLHFFHVLVSVEMNFRKTMTVKKTHAFDHVIKYSRCKKFID